MKISTSTVRGKKNNGHCENYFYDRTNLQKSIDRCSFAII